MHRNKNSGMQCPGRACAEATRCSASPHRGVGPSDEGPVRGGGTENTHDGFLEYVFIYWVSFRLKKCIAESEAISVWLK